MKTENLGYKKEGELEGRYSNYFKIGFNAFAFVLDFGQFFSGNNDSILFSRIVINPITAKNLAEVLDESILQYEQIHGAIEINDNNL